MEYKSPCHEFAWRPFLQFGGQALQKRVLKVKNFYLTTTLPYVNADPHIGFALEIVQADVIARFHRLLGEEVFFLR